jgi:hypothetical protein
VLTRREFNTGVSVVAMVAIAGLPNLAFAQRSDTVPATETPVLNSRRVSTGHL